jgi:hypothetical protein
MRTGGFIVVAAVAASLSGTAPAARASAAPAILQPVAGATVTSPVTVIVAPESAKKTGTMPAMDKGMDQDGGMKMPPGSHLHLLVDSALPKPGSMIPMDAHHIHLMHGKTKVTLRLPPGSHTLQLVGGTSGHQVPKKPQVSPVVTFSVK